MDEEEELDSTRIGQQEEAPAVNTEDVIMGGLPVLAGSTVLTNTTGGLPATTGGTLTTTTSGGQTGGGQPRLTGPTRPSASDFDFRINPARASRLARFGGPGALIYSAADLGLESLTGKGLSERIGEFGGDFLGNILFPGAQSQPAFTEAELQQSRDNLSRGAQFSLMEEDAEASVAPVAEVTPLEAGLGALDEEIAGRESNVVNNQVELAKQINELGTVTDDQRAAQGFLNERAERSGTTPTDVITPFQDQAQLTADLFTDPNTAIGQFVPRSTFRLPDGTIIQEDEGGTRREISGEQLRQFEQDMAGLGQPSVVGLGRGGDAGVIKSFDRPMGSEETIARLGGRTLNEYLNAPPVRTPGISGLKTDPQGRMIPNRPQTVAPEPVTPQPVPSEVSATTGTNVGTSAGSTGVTPGYVRAPGAQNFVTPETEGQPTAVPNEIMSQVVRTGGQTAEFRDANGDGIEDREQGIFRPGELLGYDAQGNEVRAPGTQQPVNRIPAAASPAASTNQLSPFELASLDRQLRIGGTGSFAGDSAAREAILAARPDFNEVRRDSDRRGGGLSQSDLRDLAQGTAEGATEGQKMRALEIQQRAGLGPFKPEQTDLQKEYTRQRIEVMDAQLAQSGIVPSEPPVVDSETGVITQKYSDGTIRYKGVARNPNTGGFDLDGFVSGDEGDKSSDFNKGEIREQEINGKMYRFQFDGKNWNQI